MNRQYLQSFTESQLENYQTTLKRRVADLKHLTLSLGMENLELASRYQGLVQRKRELSQASEKRKKGWNGWISRSKQKITGLLHIRKQNQTEGKNEAETIQQKDATDLAPVNPPGYNPVQEQNLLQPLSEEKKDVTVNNFNFDDLYHIGKGKLTDFIGKGTHQIKHIKEVLIDKYRIKDERVENQTTNAQQSTPQAHHNEEKGLQPVETQTKNQSAGSPNKQTPIPKQEQSQPI